MLEGASIKLATVTEDIMGVSAREILAELVAGSTDAAAMAKLARGRLRTKIPELEQALVGRLRPHHQFLIAQQLAHIDALDEAIERVSEEIAKRTHPFAESIALLDTIPGVAQRTAEVLVAEIGTDMSRFPTATHLASWAGLAPGNNESGGKRRSGKTRKRSPWLRAALVEAAHGARLHRFPGRRLTITSYIFIPAQTVAWDTRSRIVQGWARKEHRMSPTPQYVGIDVAKRHVDVAVRPGTTHWRVANQEQDMATLVTRLQELQPDLVVWTWLGLVDTLKLGV